jgi:tight adherence protein C
MALPLLIASVLLAAVALRLALRGAGATVRTSRGLAHVVDYSELGRTAAPVEAIGEGDDEQPRGRPGARAVEGLGRVLAPRLGGARLEGVRARLRSAGLYDLSAETYLGGQLALTAVGVLVGLEMAASGALSPVASIGFAVVTSYLGFALPVTMVSRRARLRTTSIDRQMPELVDLLVVAIEAGLGLASSLDRAAAHMKGALADELRLVLQEQGLGATSAEALNHLKERCDTATVRIFVRTLVQGEALGVPIGQTMRAIAVDMRKRRRAAAEEQAYKAPVKILFPLVLCVFPSLLIVILAPAAITILHGLGNG